MVKLFDSFRDAVLPIFYEYGGLPKGAKFYDLGSGRGRASFLITLLTNDFYHTRGHLSSCTGIELLTSLHALSLEAQNRWSDLYPAYLLSSRGAQQDSGSESDSDSESEHNSERRTRTCIEHLQGSILDLQCVNWTDGDLVFVNSTCFTGMPDPGS